MSACATIKTYIDSVILAQLCFLKRAFLECPTSIRIEYRTCHQHHAATITVFNEHRSRNVPATSIKLSRSSCVGSSSGVGNGVSSFAEALTCPVAWVPSERYVPKATANLLSLHSRASEQTRRGGCVTVEEVEEPNQQEIRRD